MPIRWEYAVDLGSENIRAATSDEIYTDSAYAAFRSGSDSPFLYGERALALYGREPEGVRVFSPVRNGRVEDMPLYAKWAKRLTQDGEKRVLKRSGVLFGVPRAMTESARDELSRRIIDEGIPAVGLVSNVTAGTLGAGIDALSCEGVCALDAGAEQITVALISGGRIAKCDSLSFGMSRIDELIINELRADLGISIGPRTAKAIKHELAAARGAMGGAKTEKAVYDLKDMLPRLRDISANDIRKCVDSVVNEICELCMRVIRFAPEELASDLTKNGIVAFGGGAELFGLDLAINSYTGIEVRTADEPSESIIRGLSKILRNPREYAVLIEDETEESRRP